MSEPRQLNILLLQGKLEAVDWFVSRKKRDEILKRKIVIAIIVHVSGNVSSDICMMMRCPGPWCSWVSKKSTDSQVHSILSTLNAMLLEHFRQGPDLYSAMPSESILDLPFWGPRAGKAHFPAFFGIRSSSSAWHL